MAGSARTRYWGDIAIGGRKVATQAAILDVALELFARYGFSGATTMAIADGANVSHSTVMFHFRSKPGLYAAAVTLAGDRFLEAICHEGTQSFRAIAHRWIDHLLDESSGYRLLCWLDDHQQPEIRAAAQSVRDRLAGVWCDWLAERAGRYWPPTKRSTVAILIVTVVTGLPAVAPHQRQQATGALKLLERLMETDRVSYGSDDLPAAAE